MNRTKKSPNNHRTAEGHRLSTKWWLFLILCPFLLFLIFPTIVNVLIFLIHLFLNYKVFLQDLGGIEGTGTEQIAIKLMVLLFFGGTVVGLSIKSLVKSFKKRNRSKIGFTITCLSPLVYTVLIGIFDFILGFFGDGSLIDKVYPAGLGYFSLGGIILLAFQLIVEFFKRKPWLSILIFLGILILGVCTVIGEQGSIKWATSIGAEESDYHGSLLHYALTTYLREHGSYPVQEDELTGYDGQVFRAGDNTIICRITNAPYEWTHKKYTLNDDENLMVVWDSKPHGIIAKWRMVVFVGNPDKMMRVPEEEFRKLLKEQQGIAEIK